MTDTILSGEIWDEGWDIPTKWRIDSNGICWMDNAHGGELEQSDRDLLINKLEWYREGDANKVRAHFGMDLLEPSWMRTARKHGWTPPKSEDTP